MEEKGVAVKAWIGREDYERLKELSGKTGVTVSGLVRACIRFALSQSEFMRLWENAEDLKVYLGKRK